MLHYYCQRGKEVFMEGELVRNIMLLYTDTKVNWLSRALSPNVSDHTFPGPEYNFLLCFQD
jgi:hypothetical protein